MAIQMTWNVIYAGLVVASGGSDAAVFLATQMMIVLRIGGKWN